jgi:acetyl-CoA carboxylase biotin carboxyl carrier protein
MSENTASAKAEEKAAPSPSGSPKKGRSSKASFNMDELRELAELVNEHGFTDFEFENENIRVRLGKTAAPVIQAAPAAAAVPVQAAAPAAAPVEETTAEGLPLGSHIITSPIVGTFYSQPSPDAEPYVGLGSRVQKGQAICIIEAMKLMNEIEADESGEIIEIFVDNGQPVEFGQPLFGIKPQN